MDQFPLIYRTATGLFRFFVFPFKGGIRAVGVDRVPKEGGMILAPVHMTQLDPPALAVTLRKRRLRALAKEELWKNKLFGAIIQGIGAFPLKRGAGDSESMRKCISILQGGEAVIVFPEGTRNDGETMLPLQAGIAMLAKKSGAFVVPAGISGTGKKGRARGVMVVYGEPFRYEQLATGANEKENRQIFMSHLETCIRDLCDEAGTTLRIAQSNSAQQECPIPEHKT